MENKNVVVALILMLVVWFGFNHFFPSQQPVPPSSVPSGQSEAPVASAPQTPDVEKQPAATPIAIPSAEQIKARDLTVETETYRAVFSSSGARLKSFKLKQFTFSAKPDSPPVAIVEEGADRFASLRTTGSDGFILAADAPYAISVAEDALQLGPGESRKVVFHTVTPAGLSVEKTFTFRGDGYDFDYSLNVANNSAAPLRGSVDLALVHPWDDSQKGDRFEFVGPTTLAEDEIHTDKVDDLAKESRSYGKDIVWSGFTTKYFLSIAVPMGEAVERVLVKKSDDAVENIIAAPQHSLQPGESLSFDYLLFFGPRDIEILKAVDHQLARAIDFGFFSLIARPLLHVLKFFYSYLGNYGLAIILLTSIIKIIFWPLTQKSYTSMKAMQKLQPEMQRIKEKFKNDRERLNKEVMQMYKTHRVNPLGGCLPMIVQIPVFFALYKVLMDAIELRHAPFALWITDLSAKDPYYVTPLIMGATMFIQQKMTPSNMDPMQAKVFMLMPVIFTFLFLNFPSGLVIYWLVNNVLTIGQQFFINRKA